MGDFNSLRRSDYTDAAWGAILDDLAREARNAGNSKGKEQDVGVAKHFGPLKPSAGEGEEALPLGTAPRAPARGPRADPRLRVLSQAPRSWLGLRQQQRLGRRGGTAP